MFRFLILLAIVLLLMALKPFTKTMDSSSSATINQSISEMSEDMNKEQQIKFTQALVLAATLGNEVISLEEAIQANALQSLHGLSKKQIVDKALAIYLENRKSCYEREHQQRIFGFTSVINKAQTANRHKQQEISALKSALKAGDYSADRAQVLLVEKQIWLLEKAIAKNKQVIADSQSQLTKIEQSHQPFDEQLAAQKFESAIFSKH